MSITLFHKKHNCNGVVVTNKKYFQLWKWWIGIGTQHLDCLNGLKTTTTARSNNIFCIDIWYFTMSIYRNKK